MHAAHARRRGWTVAGHVRKSSDDRSVVVFLCCQPVTNVDVEPARFAEVIVDGCRLLDLPIEAGEYALNHAGRHSARDLVVQVRRIARTLEVRETVRP